MLVRRSDICQVISRLAELRWNVGPQSLHTATAKCHSATNVPLESPPAGFARACRGQAHRQASACHCASGAKERVDTRGGTVQCPAGGR
jgi:hypothetical protein